MYITDQLIYIQMQKTGCTHIASLLSKTFGGEQIGKHNAASAEQIKSKTYFVSSTRNPWDWYLSLWTYGVQGNGGLKKRLTKKNYYKALKSLLRNPYVKDPCLLNEITKDVSLWRDVYTESGDIQSFRKWLKLIHTPSNVRWIISNNKGPGIAELCGFMTYRYMRLCCSGFDKVNKENRLTYKDIAQLEKESCYIDYFIRQETLESNFLEAVERVRPLSAQEEEYIMSAKKINTSSRPYNVSEYYDKESIELVRQRDRLLIEKFNYDPPILGDGSYS